MHKKEISGFTLVELSIGIIIIGLLVAGVAAGKNMYTQFSLNSVVTQNSTYHAALQTFYTKYNAIPGDFANAWSFFGPNCGGGDPNICNGNGNALIEWSPEGGHEDLTAWEHLSLAGMLNEKMVYTGALNIGVSVPKSTITKTGGYWFEMWESGSPLLQLGSPRVDGAPWINDGVMTPAEASAIDIKYDDGKPGTGTITGHRAQSFWYDTSLCISSTFTDPPAVIRDAVYLYSDLTTSCSVGFHITIN